MIASLGALSLKGRALRYLAAREHSRAELERKLAGLEIQPGQLAALLDELQAKGLINEQRVAESVLHRRAPRLGMARIRHELMAKGLPDDAIEPAMAALRASESERAVAVWRKKFDRPGAAPVEPARQIRFLVQRGFALELACQVVRAATGADQGADQRP